MADWKNERAEREMKLAEKEIMAKALQKEQQEIAEHWNDLKKSLYTDSDSFNTEVDRVIDALRENYELPVKKQG
jgi:flagellar biosynthesis/type III secretory pathway protein FliH